MRPEVPGYELSEEELETIAGGASWFATPNTHIISATVAAVVTIVSASVSASITTNQRP